MVSTHFKSVTRRLSREFYFSGLVSQKIPLPQEAFTS